MFAVLVYLAWLGLRELWRRLRLQRAEHGAVPRRVAISTGLWLLLGAITFLWYFYPVGLLKPIPASRLPDAAVEQVIDGVVSGRRSIQPERPDSVTVEAVRRYDCGATSLLAVSLLVDGKPWLEHAMLKKLPLLDVWLCSKGMVFLSAYTTGQLMLMPTMSGPLVEEYTLENQQLTVSRRLSGEFVLYCCILFGMDAWHGRRRKAAAENI